MIVGVYLKKKKRKMFHPRVEQFFKNCSTRGWNIFREIVPLASGTILQKLFHPRVEQFYKQFQSIRVYSNIVVYSCQTSTSDGRKNAESIAGRNGRFQSFSHNLRFGDEQIDVEITELSVIDFVATLGNRSTDILDNRIWKDIA